MYVGIYTGVCGGVYWCMWAYIQVCVGVYTGVCGHIYRCVWECILVYVGLCTGSIGQKHSVYMCRYICRCIVYVYGSV